MTEPWDDIELTPEETAAAIREWKIRKYSHEKHKDNPQLKEAKKGKDGVERYYTPANSAHGYTEGADL